MIDLFTQQILGQWVSVGLCSEMGTPEVCKYQFFSVLHIRITWETPNSQGPGCTADR